MFERKCTAWKKAFLKQEPLMTGEWQSQDISDKPMLATRELLNTSFEYKIPDTDIQLAKEVKPNLPWAEDHFQERVGGQPLNPPPSAAWWPHAQQGHAEHTQDEKFSHTYPERMWPKFAWARKAQLASEKKLNPMPGIRFPYGDLEDVVQQLKKGPLTRQAYLPIWFPEDTGAVDGQRVPCTLGYHFLIRGGELQITYYIRSCDFIRHFRDDVYMAGRLAQWMVERWNEDKSPDEKELKVGKLVMHMVSFHIFEGDVGMLKLSAAHDEVARNQRLMGAF